MDSLSLFPDGGDGAGEAGLHPRYVSGTRDYSSDAAVLSQFVTFNLRHKESIVGLLKQA